MKQLWYISDQRNALQRACRMHLTCLGPTVLPEYCLEAPLLYVHVPRYGYRRRLGRLLQTRQRNKRGKNGPRRKPKPELLAPRYPYWVLGSRQGNVSGLDVCARHTDSTQQRGKTSGKLSTPQVRRVLESLRSPPFRRPPSTTSRRR